MSEQSLKWVTRGWNEFAEMRLKWALSDQELNN